MILEALKNIRVVLGSKSPRRKELLAKLGIDFQVLVAETDEFVNPTLSSEEVVVDIAQKKLEMFRGEEFFESLVITADTAVVHKNALLGKPNDADDAFATLKPMQGQTHTVYTAVALAYRAKTRTFLEETIVEFYPLSDLEIQYYIETFAPLDKAGSYGIQDWIGLIGIKRIDGSYENVVGLPTARLYQELKDILS
ncbi:nucleoside triphosphate pyrophosphatase [Sphingobacterium sp. JB170]|uniref:Maf family protein n=1 Tax=Sphingobacterium sp. JB170 TaxID=1434842 RepID=UPI00097F37D9|nr:Maf family protein [Sphingobacterium sp. JB170]SJN32593.1 Septum formation protein Maf [Sphingobacterium sp. JB170]